MDEINKIPPVTRTLVFATAVVTVGPLLKLVNPYLILLWWPSVLKKWEIWRPFTCFFLGGSDIQFLFDLFMLLRNSTDLETNYFYRKTSEYVWSLFIINLLILVTNYPLQSTVLFSPFMMAIVYLWSRANPASRVSFFGIVNCPAPYLPYAYLFLDLLRGGTPLAIQSSTGIVSAYIYYFLKEVLPASNGERGPRLIPSAPSWLQSLLPDSTDPAVQGQAPPPGGTVRSTGWGGTAFAPAGRAWGDNQAASNATGGQRLTSGGPSIGSRIGSWLPFGGRNNGTTVGGNRTSSGPDRDAMLAAAEARLGSIRQNSIAGRNQAASALARQAANSREAQARRNKSAAATTSVAGSVLGPGTDSKTSSVQASDGYTQIRRTAAAAGGPSSRAFSFGQYDASKKVNRVEGEEEETASGSGGRVAEIRRKADSSPGEQDNQSMEEEEDKADHSWGSGRKLGD